MDNEVEYGEGLLLDAIAGLNEAKPEGRSELSRYYAVVLTDLEHVFAYYRTYITPLLEE